MWCCVVGRVKGQPFFTAGPLNVQNNCHICIDEDHPGRKPQQVGLIKQHPSCCHVYLVPTCCIQAQFDLCSFEMSFYSTPYSLPLAVQVQQTALSSPFLVSCFYKNFTAWYKCRWCSGIRNLTKIWLKIQVFWDMMLCCLVSS